MKNTFFASILLATGLAAHAAPLLLCEPVDTRDTILDSVLLEGDQATVILNVGYDDHLIKSFKVRAQYPNGIMGNPMLSADGFNMLVDINENRADSNKTKAFVMLDGNQNAEENLQAELVCTQTK